MGRPVFTPKPPVAKLPLQVRKDIRDKYEENKAELDSDITKLLGMPSGFISALKSYLEKYGDDGKAHFNTATSTCGFQRSELGDSAPTIFADVKEGVYRILFHHDRVGYNMSSQTDLILPTVEAVSTSGFSLQAKNSIENHYKGEIGDLQKEIGAITGIADVVLDPNFEENYRALSALTDTKWQANFGKQLTNDSFLDQHNVGFKKDEMLRESLQEALGSKTFKIRIVKKTTNDKTNEIVLEDGVAHLQATIERWWYNVNNKDAGLVKLLWYRYL
ncbi:hypothetical protein B0H10DRAFT_2226647 [Mycena sp. CBHHK59/15]|nr:hypothetical protein B0H10DRAFT_2226647 [Mycena sp. CBHHK59/15]